MVWFIGLRLNSTVSKQKSPNIDHCNYQWYKDDRGVCNGSLEYEDED